MRRQDEGKDADERVTVTVIAIGPQDSIPDLLDMAEQLIESQGCSYGAITDRDGNQVTWQTAKKGEYSPWTSKH